MGAEKKIEKEIKDFLERERLKGIPIFFYKQFESVGNIPGLPDIQCCINGYFVGIETKSFSGKLRDDQKVVGSNIIKAKGVYVVCNQPQLFMAFYKEFMAHPDKFMGHLINLTYAPISLRI